MAALSYNAFGVVLILEHSEVDTVVQLTEAGADVASKLKEFGVPEWLVIVLVAYFKLYGWLVRQVDQGNGIYLTLPWPAIYAVAAGGGVAGLGIVPTTRPRVGPPDNWVQIGAGQFRTEDSADTVDWRIESNAVGNDIAAFRLEADDAAMWRKVLVMPDGEGSQWDIAIDPSNGVSALKTLCGPTRSGTGRTWSSGKQRPLESCIGS